MKSHRDNIVMVKLNVSIKVTLPNSRTFHAKYKRVGINSRPNNIRIINKDVD